MQDEGIHQLLQHGHPWRYRECLQAIESSKYSVPWALTGAVERKRALIYLMIIKSSDYSTMLATCIIWLGTNHNNSEECTNIEIAAYLRLQHPNVQANYKSLYSYCLAQLYSHATLLGDVNFFLEL